MIRLGTAGRTRALALIEASPLRAADPRTKLALSLCASLAVMLPLARLALFMAVGLREGLEEMRLNPLGCEFLGPLPLQRLVMFKREIYPLVGWVGRQRRFFPNWEVADIVYIPLRSLANPERYACYQLEIETPAGNVPYEKEFPCFVHRHDQQTEILWGATFRMTMEFLKLVFGFVPPEPAALPGVKGLLKQSYFS